MPINNYNITGTPVYDNLLEDLKNWLAKRDPRPTTGAIYHSCKHCKILGFYKGTYDDLNTHALSAQLYPEKPLAKRDSWPNIKDTYKLHIFHLCCLAFGVGEWDKFRLMRPL